MPVASLNLATAASSHGTDRAVLAQDDADEVPLEIGGQPLRDDDRRTGFDILCQRRRAPVPTT